MSPTICPLDILYATKGNDIEFGDVVVFYSEEVGEMLVKRVLGMGGDRIEIKEGVLYRNGYEVEEDYVEYQDYGSYVFDIPEDSYLVLGDNRLASFDSRYWDNPYVSLDAVEGKAIMITYPYTRWSVL
jgi:signal peptidase I